MLNGGGTADKKPGTPANVSGAIFNADNASNLQLRQFGEHFLVAVHGRADGLNPLRWVVDMGGEIAQDAADQVAAGVSVLFGRRLTGTIAISGLSGSAFRSIR